MPTTQMSTYTQFIKDVFALGVALISGGFEADPSSVEITRSNDDEGVYDCRCIDPFGHPIEGTVKVGIEVPSATVLIEKINGRDARSQSRWIKRHGEIQRFD